jgi:hypothetical protein
MSTEGPFHDLLVETVYRELSKLSNRPAGREATLYQGRLLRQLPERTAQARSILETSLHSFPNDATANREWGAFLLSSRSQPRDREHAVEALERASQSPNVDDRATLLLALSTSNETALNRSAGVIDWNRNRFKSLVRAMLASRN